MSPVKDGSEFTHHRCRNQLSDQCDRSEPLESIGGLQRQHAAGEKSGQNDNWKGANADKVRLLNHVSEIKRFANEIAYRLRREQCVFLNRLNLLLNEIRGRDQFHSDQKSGESCCPDSLGLIEI